MSVLHIYWASLFISALFHVMFWYAPWAYGALDSETQGLLSWGNHGAWIEVPDWVGTALLFATLATYAGMALFRRLFRTLFVALTVITVAASPAFGLNVITNIEVFLVDVSVLLKGLAIGLAYFSPLEERFY